MTTRLKTCARDNDSSWSKPFQASVAGLVREDPLERQLTHFCDVIRGTAKPLVTVQDGLQNLRVTEAIAEAARTRAASSARWTPEQGHPPGRRQRSKDRQEHQERGNNMQSVLVINGPNLNLLGTREPQIYGSTTLADVEAALKQQAAGMGLSLDCFQSNHEGAIVDRIHAARTEGVSYILINLGAFTHTSVAIRDACRRGDSFRGGAYLERARSVRRSDITLYLSDIAEAVMAGFGTQGYGLALQFIGAKPTAVPASRKRRGPAENSAGRASHRDALQRSGGLVRGRARDRARRHEVQPGQREEVRAGDHGEQHRVVVMRPGQHVADQLGHEHAADGAHHAAEAEHGTDDFLGRVVHHHAPDVRGPGLVRADGDRDRRHRHPQAAGAGVRTRSW
ncbi:type II 3-dehydroquinate dehydratase [Cupriavidus basilensis]